MVRRVDHANRFEAGSVEKLVLEITGRKQREAALAASEACNQAAQSTKSLRTILADLKCQANGYGVEHRRHLAWSAEPETSSAGSMRCCATDVMGRRPSDAMLAAAYSSASTCVVSDASEILRTSLMLNGASSPCRAPCSASHPSRTDSSRSCGLGCRMAAAARAPSSRGSQLPVAARPSPRIGGAKSYVREEIVMFPAVWQIRFDPNLADQAVECCRTP